MLQPAELVGTNSLVLPSTSRRDATAESEIGSPIVQVIAVVSLGPRIVTVHEAGNGRQEDLAVTEPRRTKPSGGCPGTLNLGTNPRTSNGTQGPGLHVALVTRSVGVDPSRTCATLFEALDVGPLGPQAVAARMAALATVVLIVIGFSSLIAPARGLNRLGPPARDNCVQPFGPLSSHQFCRV